MAKNKNGNNVEADLHSDQKPVTAKGDFITPPDIEDKNKSVPQPSHPARIASVDLARGLAMVFMVAVHVLHTYATVSVASSPFGLVIDFFGSPPAAPVFMLLMGVSFAFSSRSSAAKGVRRGIQLVLLGYLLNLLRGALPVYLALRFGWTTLEEIVPHTPGYEFTTIDILQFAGLALVIISLLRPILKTDMHWLGLAVVVTLISPLLWGCMTGFAPVDFLLTLFWGAGGEHVAFPVFPWLAYVLTGVPLGNWLAASGKRNTVFQRGALAGLGLLIIGTLISLTNITFHLGDYWRTGPGGVIWITGFVLVWLWLCHIASARLERTPFFTLMAFWSRNVTVFYFIHWVIIGWGMFFLGYQQHGLLTTLFLMPLVAALADLATRQWNKFRRRTYTSRK